jgi:hypothetical protein
MVLVNKKHKVERIGENREEETNERTTEVQIFLRLEGDKGEEDPNSTTTKIAFKKSALGTSWSTSVVGPPSVTTSSTDFSFQNLDCWNLFENFQWQKSL